MTEVEGLSDLLEIVDINDFPEATDYVVVTPRPSPVIDPERQRVTLPVDAGQLPS